MYKLYIPEMNIFALFVFLLSCFSPASAESHAAITRRLLQGDYRTVVKYCYRSEDHVAYYYGRRAADACMVYKERLERKKRDDQEKWEKTRLCRTAAGCGPNDATSCSYEVLNECEDRYGLVFYRFCTKNHDELVKIDAMSDWFGPIKWILRFLKKMQVQTDCGYLERH